MSKNRDDRMVVLASEPAPAVQRTLRHPIGCVGVGRHSGARVALTLHPAPAGSGISFRRTDRAGALPVPAAARHLVPSEHAFVLTGEDGSRIASVEHVLAALALTGIHNALIELNGPEVPAMDGSAQPFVFLIECAGVASQDVLCASRPCIVDAVEVRRGTAWARLAPAEQPSLVSTVTLPELGSLTHRVALRPEALRHELAAARHSASLADIVAGQERGLWRGVSARNTVLFDGPTPTNEEGLRCADEPARHGNLLALAALGLLGGQPSGLPAVELVTEEAGCGLLAELLRRALALPARPAAEVPAEALPVREPLGARTS
jgi:UDP-3-O-[3-hydroxymyristoyl] N-acetylglucosamine deacetylase